MKRLLLSGFLFGLFTLNSSSSTISYKFLIPAFGGDPNYFYVFKSEADAQNIYHPPEKPIHKTTPAEDFKRKLTYMVMNKLADKIVAAAFGETTEAPQGSYTVGDYEIHIQPTEDSIQVEMTDITTGVTTTVVVPKYKF